MKQFAKIFSRINSSVFTFFSGVFVSFTLNLFTGIILDRSIAFDVFTVTALVLVLIGSGALMIGSIFQQKYIEEVNQAKKLGISIDQLLKTKKARDLTAKHIAVLFLAIALIIGGVVLFCINYNFHQ